MFLYAPVAQWIEQETSKLLAVGSIPTRGTRFEPTTFSREGHFSCAFTKQVLHLKKRHALSVDGMDRCSIKGRLSILALAEPR